MILIIGASGHTGLFLLEELSSSKISYDIKCLVRINSLNLEKIKKYDTELIFGDIQNDKALKDAMRDVDTIIHLAGILYSERVLSFAKNSSVKRIIFIHTTGIYSRFGVYAKEYKKIENYLFDQCKIDYIILRPTMIYGSNLDYNMHKLIGYIKNHKVFPVFGSGNNLMQPIHARDLATAIVLVLNKPSIKNKSYCLSGGSILSYRNILFLIASIVNPKIKFIFIPYRLSLVLGVIYCFFCKLLVKTPQISVEQLRRLNEDKSYSYKDAQDDFGYKPISFEEGIKDEIISLRGQ